MIFERLANFILKRSKLIIAIWIILLICAIPFTMKAGSVLDYDGNEMGGQDSESIQGANIIQDYFHSSSIKMEAAVLLVISYGSSEEKTEAYDLGNALIAERPGYVDESGNPKISNIIQYATFEDSSKPSEGVVLYAIVYVSEDVSVITGDIKNLRDFVSKVAADNDISGPRTYVTGSPAISHDTEVGASEDLAKIDPFTILLILILVGLFFRSFVTSAMPPLTIGVAFGMVMCLMYFIGSIMNIFFITEMFLLVSMLGAGCDYCIFILARYREERVKGNDHEGALKNAVTWAGESITTSGIAVMIGFGAMSICSFPMISTMGIMLALGILVALLAALTLITSVLAVFGERLFWPSKIDMFKEGGKAMKGWYGKVSKAGRRYFVHSSRTSMKYAKAIIITAVLLTIPSVYIMATSESSYDMIGSMSSGEAIQGLDEMEKYTNSGMIMPNYVVFEMEDSIGEISKVPLTIAGTIDVLLWTNPGYLVELAELQFDLYGDDNIGAVMGVLPWESLVLPAAVIIGPPTIGETDRHYTERVFDEAISVMPDTTQAELNLFIKGILDALQANGMSVKFDDTILIGAIDYVLNYVSMTSVGGEQQDGTTTVELNYVKFTVITKEESMSDRSMDTIGFMDGVVNKFVSENEDIIANSWLTGTAVVMYEISEQVNKEFIKVEILAILAIFVLLFIVMRSYLTPLRSILTILMSVAWTIALTHLIFTNLLGEGVIWMIPIILIVICLGLGMDYDILLTTRIRENRMHKGMSNDEAIEAAVTYSGSVITICGLIMGGAFGTLMLSSSTMLQEFGFALCFAIIVDALIVRTYIVPAAMHLLGDWNWKGPKFMEKKELK